MNSLSATAVGFRLILRRPLISFAEIAWRWTFAAAAWALGIACLLQYFDSLPVRSLDRLLLSTGHPLLIAQAMRRIFAGSSVRAVEAGILLGVGLAIAWIVLASLGRLVVLRSVFDEFEVATDPPHAFRSLVFLNFLRAAITLATKIGAAGSVLIASSLWASSHARLADAGRLVFLSWFLLWFTWTVLNWLLSAGAVFVVAEGKDALAAIAAMLQLLQSQTAGVLAAGAVFGLIHLGILVITSGILLTVMPIALARPITLPLVFAVIFAYCFVADFLYTGRLAAYAFLARGPEEVPAWMGMRPIAPPGGERLAAIDQDELILSDVPAPA